MILLNKPKETVQVSNSFFVWLRPTSILVFKFILTEMTGFHCRQYSRTRHTQKGFMPVLTINPSVFDLIYDCLSPLGRFSYQNTISKLKNNNKT